MKKYLNLIMKDFITSKAFKVLYIIAIVLIIAWFSLPLCVKVLPHYANWPLMESTFGELAGSTEVWADAKIDLQTEYTIWGSYILDRLGFGVLGFGALLIPFATYWCFLILSLLLLYWSYSLIKYIFKGIKNIKPYFKTLKERVQDD